MYFFSNNKVKLKFLTFAAVCPSRRSKRFVFVSPRVINRNQSIEALSKLGARQKVRKQRRWARIPRGKLAAANKKALSLMKTTFLVRRIKTKTFLPLLRNYCQLSAVISGKSYVIKVRYSIIKVMCVSLWWTDRNDERRTAEATKTCLWKRNTHQKKRRKYVDV